MINTFFTSDTHFFHANILQYEDKARPFKTLEEMHEVMIDRWNSVVRRNDIIYHLGDFCFGKSNIVIASRLNGKKRLILGNHDVYPIRDYLEYFDKVYGCLFYKSCILTHIPVHPDHSRALLNVHGHLHSKKVETLDTNNLQLSYLRDDYIEDMHYFNVSVEQNNLTPFHYDAIEERLKLLD